MLYAQHNIFVIDYAAVAVNRIHDAIILNSKWNQNAHSYVPFETINNCLQFIKAFVRNIKAH